MDKWSMRMPAGLFVRTATTAIVPGNETNTPFFLTRASTPDGRGETMAALRLAATF